MLCFIIDFSFLNVVLDCQSMRRRRSTALIGNNFHSQAKMGKGERRNIRKGKGRDRHSDIFDHGDLNWVCRIIFAWKVSL